MVKKIRRNDPCPCGSGRKYKKCCLGTDKDPLLKVHMMKCGICERDFDSNLIGTFQSEEKEGKRIYFCPDCNLNLSCSICKKKLGTESFNLYSCPDCGGVTIICEDCMEKGELPESHHKPKSFLHRWLGLK